jgi:hypothetical protein
MKKRKFQTGGATGDYMADIRRRAAEYAKMADKASGTEETEDQKAFIRKQAGREDYGRSKPAQKPEPKKATPKSQPDALTNELIASFRKKTEDEIQGQKLQDMLEDRAIPAGTEEKIAAPKKKDDAMRAEQSVARPADYEKRIRGQAIESISPESYLPGAMGMKAALTGAKALAGRGMQKADDAAARVFSRPQARETTTYDPAGSRAFAEAGTKRASEERARQAARADQYRSLQERRKAAAEARKARETSRMEGEGMGTAKARGNPKNQPPGPRDMDELRMSGEGMGFKKGGKTKKYAQGGSVSARADGIAKRGRTNCKVY